MKIAFVTDGGKEMGMGHVQQSVTLAKEFNDKAEVIFLTKSDASVIRHIRNSDFTVIGRVNDDELLQSLKDMAPQWVIIDKIDVAEDFARRIKDEISTKLAIFTNLTAANQYADIAVTADYASYFKNIKFYDERTKTLYYYGPKYWILRKEFCELHEKAKRVSDRIKRILIIFGGSDPLNITSAVVDTLLQLPEHYCIDIILGTGFTFINQLNQVLGKHSDNCRTVEIYKDIKNVAAMMFNADLVITSPGLSLFEALSVGTPVIAFHQNNIQKERTAQVYRGCIPTLSVADIEKLPNLIYKRNYINPNDQFVVNLEIGQGKAEIVNLFLG
jgi:UDP-2,4-diacetamido-2,4,6-trideoxy-beta-L-altropyranose hydrolase